MLCPTPSCPVCVEIGEVNATRLLKCTGCGAIYYCGTDHQAAHRPRHKTACNAVKKARRILFTEEASLRHYETAAGDETNFFDIEYYGLFGSFWETTKYMESRRSLMMCLTEVGTYEAIVSVYHMMLCTLYLDRSDQMGVRYIFPFVGLRLGGNQDVYDFCEWYRMLDFQMEYDFEDNTFPFLDLVGADVFKRTGDRDDGLYEFAHEIAMALLKFRLLKCLENLQNSHLLSSRLPAEIIALVKLQILQDYGLAHRKDLLKESNYQKKMMDMDQEIYEHYNLVNASNCYYWQMLFRAPESLIEEPQFILKLEATEAQETLKDSYHAWVETPGAIEYMKKVKERSDEEYLLEMS